MEFLIDAHTHTLASGHAYNTILEMVSAARGKNLEILGITEHGPAMAGSCQDIYFNNLRSIDRKVFGMEVLLGAELNIIDYKGGTDLRGDIIREMDITIASLHNVCIAIGSREQNTAALIGAIKNPLIDIIGHPDDGHFPLDYEAVVKAAKEYGKPLELNNGSLKPGGFRINAWENNMEILKLSARCGVEILISSDAHFSTDVAEYSYVQEFLKEADFPEELLLNGNPDRFRKMVHKYKKSGL
ncbi:phosphatase [Parasporobacterium paucivorans]|uniref:Putative hydrolase n=1 Tax=Parasporobacterium paucivorans DSM 15970 TaxID=1122934 RepID=A0A1M6H9H5_9FIRM|nr:phosphatase [Parasporobacterium paucivorans]SHJ18749.1 putative hydrolase [Parasporobacterium paucivorans DSM 15970]